VTQSPTTRKITHGFLLVFYGTYHVPLFWDIAKYSLKIANYSYITCI